MLDPLVDQTRSPPVVDLVVALLAAVLVVQCQVWPSWWARRRQPSRPRIAAAVEQTPMRGLGLVRKRLFVVVEQLVKG